MKNRREEVIVWRNERVEFDWSNVHLFYFNPLQGQVTNSFLLKTSSTPPRIPLYPAALNPLSIGFSTLWIFVRIAFSKYLTRSIDVSYFTSIPIDRAVPAIILIACSMSLAFKSGIFFSAI